MSLPVSGRRISMFPSDTVLVVLSSPGKAGIVSFMKDLGPIVVGLGAILATAVFNRAALTQRIQESTATERQRELESNRSVRLKQNEELRREIHEQLSSFYGPMQQLLGISGALYERFSAGRPAGYRTLVALLSGETFEGNDRVLLDAIIEIGEEMRGLIMKESG